MRTAGWTILLALAATGCSATTKDTGGGGEGGVTGLTSGATATGGGGGNQGAGSGGGGGDGGAGAGGSGAPSIASVAHDLAAADCASKFKCMPYASLTRAWGDDVADCTRETAGYLTRALSAPGASPDLALPRACTAQLKVASCKDYLDYSSGQDPTKVPACSTFPPGSLPDGAGCAYGRQCKSDFCNSAEGQCGQCAPRLTNAGAPCGANQWCDPAKGLLCNLATNVCFVPHRRGESCNVYSDCFYNLACSNSKCADWPDTVGAPCDPNADNCSFRLGAGLICNNQSNSCQLPTTAGVGSPCGLGGPTGGLVVCGKGAMCDGSKDGFSGTCLPGHAAPAGGHCAFTGAPPDGAACESEAECLGGSCKLDDPKLCK